MKCLFCGTENLPEATFCKKCGHRLDGMSVCQHCGKLTPTDGQFCIHCGSNRDALVEEPVFPRSEPPKPRPVDAVSENPVVKKSMPVVAAKSPKVSSSAKSAKVHWILNLSSFISSCVVLLFSLIFTFLIGSVAKVASGSSSAEIPGAQNYNLYYFFGDAYAGLDAAGEVMPYGLIGPLLGTISVALILIAALLVLIFDVRSIIKFVKKEETSITMIAVIAYFVYLASNALFMLNVAGKTSIAGIAIVYSLNGASIAGIVIGAIFVVASLVLDAIDRGIVYSLKSYLTQGILGGVLTLFGILVLAFVGMELFTVTTNNNILNTETGYGLSSYASLLFQSAMSNYFATADVWSEFINKFVGSLIFLILILVLAIAFLTFLILMVKDALTDFGFGFEKKGTSRNGFLAGSCAILLGVMELLLPICFSSYFFPEMSIGMTTPILVLVFGALLLAGSITAKVLCKPAPTAEEETTEVAEA